MHPRQLPCWITHTNERTHDIIRAGLDRSPMFTGVIEGVGPRYCPSIEDKVHRFADKASHQIFLEPEGLTTNEIYPNGISTSLPFDVQLELVRSIRGLENAHIVRPGYAIEYDYFDPRESASDSLETKSHRRAVLRRPDQRHDRLRGGGGARPARRASMRRPRRLAREPWSPRRDQAYLGVLVDDLVTRGVSEPYRMFTSRAEYRLLLREDNADLRLTEAGRRLGLVDDARWEAFSRKRDAIGQEAQRLQSTYVSTAFMKSTLLYELLRRPEAIVRAARPGLGSSTPRSSNRSKFRRSTRATSSASAPRWSAAPKSESRELPPDLDYRQVQRAFGRSRSRSLTATGPKPSARRRAFRASRRRRSRSCSCI